MPDRKFTQTVEFPESYSEVAEAALVRLGVLRPQLDVELIGRKFCICSDEHLDRVSIKKEIMNLLYREKVFAETTEIRSKILG